MGLGTQKILFDPGGETWYDWMPRGSGEDVMAHFVASGSFSNTQPGLTLGGKLSGARGRIFKGTEFARSLPAQHMEAKSIANKLNV